jgi:hypothetical protein
VAKAVSEGNGVGLHGEKDSSNLFNRRKAEAVALRQAIMKQFNFSANGGAVQVSTLNPADP